MSADQKRHVSKLVKNYRRRFPEAPRPLMRKLIRLELTQCNTRLPLAVEKKLDRELQKAFKEGQTLSGPRPDFAPTVTRSFPKVHFFVTQQIIGLNEQWQLPNVGFNVQNLSEYPIKLEVEARTILNGREIGLIMDKEGYYSGKRIWSFDPYGGLKNGNFSIQKECLPDDDEKLTIEFRVKTIDESGQEQKLSPRSWSYLKDTNSWFFEPTSFTRDKK